MARGENCYWEKSLEYLVHCHLKCVFQKIDRFDVTSTTSDHVFQAPQMGTQVGTLKKTLMRYWELVNVLRRELQPPEMELEDNIRCTTHN